MATLKQLTQRPERLTAGHRLCAGCGAPIVVRQILRATEHPVVIANATGCLEVSTSVYPHSAWEVPWIHTAFENVAATLSGVEGAYQSLKRQGKLDDELRFVAFAGDGGTYDIGFQALSGAMERGHHMVYVCYDNGAYMNTGIQRSSATPYGADTTTTPAGRVVPGKTMHRKDMTAIMAAHNIPYVAQVSPSHWRDLDKKAVKAFEAGGAAFINALAPCWRGWRAKSEESIELCRLAVDTCYWPLFEVENGEWRLTYRPKEKLPLEEFLKKQGRFRHLFRPENKESLEALQKEVDRNWEHLLKRTEA